MSTDLNKLPSELLGYHFIIFQDNYRGYVKCWIDGSENYTYFSESDFLKMFLKVNASSDLIYEAKCNLTTTGIYLWNIDLGKIQRLHNNSEIDGITSEINKLNPYSGKSERFSL